MRIVKLEAIPISFPVPENKSVRLGIGRSVKRDSVLVRVETDDGVIGWGEAHHGRAPGAIARLIDTTMRELIINHDVLDINGIWSKVYKMQISSHGMGAASVLALSGDRPCAMGYSLTGHASTTLSIAWRSTQKN